MTVATDGRPTNIQGQMTLQEYLDYDHDTDTWYELEDGVLVDMSGEHPLNCRIAVMLLFLFYRLGIAEQLLAIGHQIEVRSSSATCRQPDLIVHTVESDAALTGDDKILYLGLPSPLLVVEVASSTLTDSTSRKRDYENKPREYADRGIPEMWIIDPDRNWVKIGTLTDAAYQFETFMGDDAIVSPTFSALNLTASQVLSAGR
ncbi:MAG: Uma2 family endonuclease [Alkalinema sp. CAN_BIN05]|nr:Uma2 family endonuclease [Alkalinema sp. CAN_BIN05]